MIIDEKALVKAMGKAALSGGYRVRFDPEHAEIAIYAERWFVKTKMTATPRKVIGLLAEHFGYVPEEGCFEVQKSKHDDTAAIQSFQDEVFESTANYYCHAVYHKAGWLPATAWGRALAMDNMRKLYAVSPELTELETIDSIVSIPEASALCWFDDNSFLAMQASTAVDFDGPKADILAALEKIEWDVDSSNERDERASGAEQMELGDAPEADDAKEGDEE